MFDRNNGIGGNKKGENKEDRCFINELVQFVLPDDTGQVAWMGQSIMI